jgi:hypothetical protein
MGQLWYCRISDQEYGPFDSSKLRSLAAQKKLLPTHHVRLAPSTDWTSAANVKGLFRSEAVATKAPAPPARRWFVSIKGQELGPYTDQQLTQFAARGELRPDHFVRIDGQPAWHEARRIQGLFAAASGDGKESSAKAAQKESVLNGINISVTREPSTLKHCYRTTGATASEFVTRGFSLRKIFNALRPTERITSAPDYRPK